MHATEAGPPAPLFVSRRSQIVTLAARHAVAAMYVARDFAEAGGPSERPQFRFLNQHHLPGLTQINEPRGISVYAFSMEATEPNERLAGASNTEHRKCPLRNFTSATASKTRKLTSADRVTFVYSTIERKGEVIEVLFDRRDEAVDLSVDSVRKVSTGQS